jgi:hypothetical protein
MAAGSSLSERLCLNGTPLKTTTAMRHLPT